MTLAEKARRNREIALGRNRRTTLRPVSGNRG